MTFRLRECIGTIAILVAAPVLMAECAICREKAGTGPTPTALVTPRSADSGANIARAGPATSDTMSTCGFLGVPTVEQTERGKWRVRRDDMQARVSAGIALRPTFLVLQRADDRTFGLRLLGTPGGPRCGVESGDLIETINGISPLSPDNGIAILNEFRTALRIVVRGRRRGGPFVVEYDID